jgi:predicted ATP-dependent endonuclease of OLD family
MPLFKNFKSNPNLLLQIKVKVQISIEKIEYRNLQIFTSKCLTHSSTLDDHLNYQRMIKCNGNFYDKFDLPPTPHTLETKNKKFKLSFFLGKTEVSHFFIHSG